MMAAAELAKAKGPLITTHIGITPPGRANPASPRAAEIARVFAGAGMLMKVGIPVADLIVSAKERHSSAEIQARFCRNCVYSRLSQASTGTSNGSASKKSFENLIDFLKRVY